jgi:hypothetical protein
MSVTAILRWDGRAQLPYSCSAVVTSLFGPELSGLLDPARMATLVMLPLIPSLAVAFVASLHTSVAGLVVASLAADSVKGVGENELLGFLTVASVVEPLRLLAGTSCGCSSVGLADRSSNASRTENSGPIRF